MRTAPLSERAKPWWRSLGAKWLVPLAAAATGVAIWIAVPGQQIDRVVQAFLHDRTRLQPMGAHELLHRLSDDQIILLDVRPAEEYAAGHLPQARSIPVTELEARLAELPVDKEIVAYCRGPYCVFADEAVALLRARGYQAHQLEQGVPEWRTLGLPIEV